MNLDRVKHLITHSETTQGKYILYFMHQSFRIEYNHALIHAITLANLSHLPLVVFIGIDIDSPYTNTRNLTFMIQGLKELDQELKKRHIQVIFHFRDLLNNLTPYLVESQAVVSDVGYTNESRSLQKALYTEILLNHPSLDLFTVESEVIVPIELISNKLEYGAYTIRPKIIRLLPDFSVSEIVPNLDNASRLFGESKQLIVNVDEIFQQYPIEEITPSTVFIGGYIEAKKRLKLFLNQHLSQYDHSSDPSLQSTSKLSAYIRHGQISTLEIYLAILDTPAPQKCKQAFIEQIIIRRELAFNFVFYERGYSEFDHMTLPWAYQSMLSHTGDERATLYQKEDYLAFRTHDPYFNACMKELLYTGFMHNYMRMYWAKKIIEWSLTYRQAFQILMELNNTYAIDGRDPNTYAGIAWCFGRHDRAWPERIIFGKLRYMNASGLKRKFNIDQYVDEMSILEHSISMYPDIGV